MKRSLIATILALLTLLAGCAPATRVTLLPQADAATGSVDVRAGQASTLLNQPYESAAVRSRGVEVEQLDAEDVRKRYGTLLAVQPAAAQRFTLFFQPGTSQLTPESTNELADVLARATARPGGEIIVVGHTDSVGPGPANDALSLQRAQAIRQLLIQRGFDANRVEAVGRGEREPVVASGDEVNEPKNRRAEIVVR